MTYREERRGSGFPSQKADLISNLIYSIKRRVLFVVRVEICEFVEINRFPRVKKMALWQALFFFGRVNEGVAVAAVVETVRTMIISNTGCIEDYSCREQIFY
jgi:hypothetical protein